MVGKDTARGRGERSSRTGGEDDFGHKAVGSLACLFGGRARKLSLSKDFKTAVSPPHAPHTETWPRWRWRPPFGRRGDAGRCRAAPRCSNRCWSAWDEDGGMCDLITMQSLPSLLNTLQKQTLEDAAAGGPDATAGSSETLRWAGCTFRSLAVILALGWRWRLLNVVGDGGTSATAPDSARMFTMAAVPVGLASGEGGGGEGEMDRERKSEPHNSPVAESRHRLSSIHVVSV